MFRPVIIFAAFALALVQSYVPADNNDRIGYVSESQISDAVDDWLADLKEVVSSGKKNSDEALEKIKTTVKATADRITQRTEDELSDETDNFNNEIANLKQEATDLQVDIKECLDGREDKLAELSKTFAAKISECENDKIKEINSLVDKAEDNIEEISKQVKVLEDEYAACKDSECKLTVGTKIGSAIFRLPLNFTETISDANKLISSLLLDMEMCSVGDIKSLCTEGQGILREITDCVKDKVKDVTPSPDE